MRADTVLILAAGLGTRMGEIGKDLPKPLWPHKGSTLLARQIQFARQLTDGQIWVNTHHCADQIDSYLKRFFPSVKTVFEKEILGSGGAVHNLIQQEDIKGRLITINSDVLYSLSKDDQERFLSPLNDVCARLVSMSVENVEDYNELVCEGKRLIAINRAKKGPYKTYCGIGLIELKKIRPKLGVSSFFETVAPFKDQRVEVVDLQSLQTTDYGTLEHFFKGSSRIEKSEIGILNMAKNGATFEIIYQRT